MDVYANAGFGAAVSLARLCIAEPGLWIFPALRRVLSELEFVLDEAHDEAVVWSEHAR